MTETTDPYEGSLLLEIHAAKHSIESDIQDVEAVIDRVKYKLQYGKPAFNSLGELQGVGARLDADVSRLAALQQALELYREAKA